MLFVFTGMGWGKSVETSMVGYKSKRAGTLVTYITPIVVSLIFAGLIKVALVFLAVFFADVVWADYLMTFLGTLRHYFVIIAVFNLIPVYPLCGNRILRCFLSPNAQIRTVSYTHLDVYKRQDYSNAVKQKYADGILNDEDLEREKLKLAEMMEELKANSIIMDMLDAETQFSMLVNQVMTIINSTVSGDEGGCSSCSSGGCAGCSGCH